MLWCFTQYEFKLYILTKTLYAYLFTVSKRACCNFNHDTFPTLKIGQLFNLFIINLESTGLLNFHNCKIFKNYTSWHYEILLQYIILSTFPELFGIRLKAWKQNLLIIYQSTWISTKYIYIVYFTLEVAEKFCRLNSFFKIQVFDLNVPWCKLKFKMKWNNLIWYKRTRAKEKANMHQNWKRAQGQGILIQKLVLIKKAKPLKYWFIIFLPHLFGSLKASYNKYNTSLFSYSLHFDN